MNKMLYVVALCLGTVVIGNGCLSEPSTGEDSESIVIGGGGQCGPNVCTGKTFCCNASCGICAPIGGACTQQFCDAADIASSDDVVASSDDLAGEQVSRPDVVEDVIIVVPQKCGAVTCSPGTHCCNASCGVCVPPGGFCTQQICSSPD